MLADFTAGFLALFAARAVGCPATGVRLRDAVAVAAGTFFVASLVFTFVFVFAALLAGLVAAFVLLTVLPAPVVFAIVIVPLSKTGLPRKSKPEQTIRIF